MIVELDHPVRYELLEYDEIKKLADITNYKSIIKVIGGSDIASLTLRFPCKVVDLRFGEDGMYTAYIITEETKVPDHYEKVVDGECWIKIYDDESLTLELNAHSIEVYRAGSLGCLIRLSK